MRAPASEGGSVTIRETWYDTKADIGSVMRSALAARSRQRDRFAVNDLFTYARLTTV
jgi:hypothetical protein